MIPLTCSSDEHFSIPFFLFPFILPSIFPCFLPSFIPSFLLPSFFPLHFILLPSLLHPSIHPPIHPTNQTRNQTNNPQKVRTQRTLDDHLASLCKSLHKEALEREMTRSEPLQSHAGHQGPQLPLYEAFFPLDDVLSKQMKCLLLS